MIWIKRAALLIGVLILLANLCLAVFLTEAAMHPPRVRRNEDVALPMHNVQQATGASATPVSITAADGTVLKAWWLLPPTPTSRAVIVCHGIADSAAGSIGFAPLFLRNGYAVLVPESRGHGASTGFVTFGIYESQDIVQWLQWVKQQGSFTTYGLGESLGGAILLQSLAHHADFHALIAESAYASFKEVADDRVGKWMGPTAAHILVRECMLYARLRYHINLWDCDTTAAIAHTQVPIFLIHGLNDTETPPKHSQEMANANPAIQLWLVSNAVHTGAYSAAPDQFETKVLAWFRR